MKLFFRALDKNDNLQILNILVEEVAERVQHST
jgi:hypothetical protein